MPNILRGIIPPLITPLTPSHSLDEAGLSRLIERVIGGGVSALFLLGTTGESPSLPLALKERLIQRGCAQANRRVPVVVNITSTAVTEVFSLARSAAQAGAAALVLGPPFYFALTQDELTGYLQRVIPLLPLPVYLYNYPQLFKVPIETATLSRIRSLSQVLGLKDSSGDMAYFKAVRKLFPAGSGFGLYCGPEEQLAEALQAGADGGVSGGANLFPRLYVDLCQAHARGDSATLQKLQEIILQVSRGIYGVSGGYVGTVRGLKCALAELAVIAGATTAEPLGPLSPGVSARIAANTHSVEQLLSERVA